MYDALPAETVVVYDVRLISQSINQFEFSVFRTHHKTALQLVQNPIRRQGQQA